MMRVALRVLGERIAVEAPQPGEQARIDEVLPLLRAIDDQAIGLAVQRSEAAGEPISCRKGCSTCCRAQPVPVTPPEAHALLRLVEALPEPRRTVIRDRFADRVERLRAADLLTPFLDRDPNLSNEAARAIAERYFRLGLVCPLRTTPAASMRIVPSSAGSTW